MNRVPPSFHALVSLSNTRRDAAMVNEATAAPVGVKRISGSLVRLPMAVMVVSPNDMGSRVLSLFGVAETDEGMTTLAPAGVAGASVGTGCAVWVGAG